MFQVAGTGPVGTRHAAADEDLDDARQVRRGRAGGD
jgi:hypothetical protein